MPQFRPAFFAAALLLLSSCAPAAPSQSQLATAVAQLAAPVTQTAAAQPSVTSATTSSPTPTLAASATLSIDPTGPHGDGVYLVGVDIAPGVWRPIAGDQDRFCYWARRKYDGIILGSFYGPSGSEVLLRTTDYEVEFDGCGVWVYMGER